MRILRIKLNDMISIISNAYKNLGFIIRNSRYFSDVSTLTLLYNAFVRAKLEYSSIVWNPHYQIYISKIERVQRRFLKFLSYKEDGFYPARGTSQTELLNRFQLSHLALRRTCFSVKFLYKLLNNIICSPHLLNCLCFNVPNIQTRSYELFYLPAPRTNVLKYSPIYVMCSNYIKYQNTIDIFNCNTTIITRCMLD